MSVARALLVAVSAFAADVTWARYTLSVARLKAGASAVWAAGIIALGAVSVDAYVDSMWYLVPAAVGAATGTYVTVARSSAVR